MLIPLFRDLQYPDIAFMTLEELKPERYYAILPHGPLLRRQGHCVQQPCDFRHVGLHPDRRLLSSASLRGKSARAFRSRAATNGRSPSPMSASASKPAPRPRSEQPGRLVRDRALPESARLPGRLRRPAPHPWGRPRVGCNPPRRRRPDGPCAAGMRPLAQARGLFVGSFRAASPGSPGPSARAS